METAEQILDKWLTNFPWQYWGKQNAIKAMNEFAEQQVKLLAAPDVSKCEGIEREALLLDFMSHVFDLKDKRYSQDFAKNTVNDYLKIKQ